MELSILIQKENDSSYQYQIVEQIIELIKTERILPGERLPASRTLSEQLQLSRNTIKGAYDKLIEQGYIESKMGSGTYVCTILPDDAIKINKTITNNNSLKQSHPVELNSKTKGKEEKLYKIDFPKVLYDFQIEKTDPHSFPTKAWRRIINDRLSSAHSHMAKYSDPTGLFELKTAIATRLGVTRGMKVDPEQVIVLTGIQQGLNIVSHLFIRNGSKVILESPGYKGASYLFNNYGAEIIPVPIDEDGISIDELPNDQISVAMITPSRHFPLCATLPIDRRKQLIKWANDTDSYILEVDYDSDFRYEGSPLRAIRSFDNDERVIYLSSFSKSIGPGLRIGYMVLPTFLVEHAKSSKTLLDYGLPWLDQIIMTDFLSNGGFDNHIKRLRQTYLNRRNCLLDSLEQAFGPVTIRGHECGSHIVWELPKNFLSAENLQRQALTKQVGIYTLNHHTVYNSQDISNSNKIILLGYAGITEENIKRGISQLSSIV